MFRIIATLMTITFILIGTPDSNAASKDTLIIALTGEPPTMDPHRTSNFIGSMVWQWSYYNLIPTEAGTGKLIPWLAERWEKLEGSKRVKFWLRKDAKFTDGSPVTSEAVKFTMSRVMKAKRQASFFKTFDRIEIIDDKTFIWHNKTHDNGMFNRIALWAGPISLIVKKKDKANIVKPDAPNPALAGLASASGSRVQIPFDRLIEYLQGTDGGPDGSTEALLLSLIRSEKISEDELLKLKRLADEEDTPPNRKGKRS